MYYYVRNKIIKNICSVFRFWGCFWRFHTKKITKTERRYDEVSGVKGDILESRRIWEALGRQFAATTIDLYGYGNIEDIVTVITLKREYTEQI